MSSLTRDEIRAALTGPIASIRVPFRHDGSLDVTGLRNAVEFDIAAGSRTMLQTYGDSLHSLLTDDEVGEVANIIVEQTAGRAMVVAADRQWSTPQEVEYARYARELGADVLMVLPPDWGASCTVDSLVEHYAAVAAEIPVMVVTAGFIARGAHFGLQVIERLVHEVPNVVAVKDDFCGEFGRKLALLAHDHLAVFAGGQKQNHLNMYPYGCDGYLSTFITLKPEIAHAYWSAIERQDLAAARDIIVKYDMPFFDYLIGLPGGFDAGIHAAGELYGIGGRWRRKPYYSLNDEEMERLAEHLRGMGLF
ncbi:MAG: dihydrodipicolinate synthase family protein [Armatimonadota bacterium]